MIHLEMTKRAAGSEAHVALIGDLDEAGGTTARRQLKRTVESGTIDLTIDLDGVGAFESSGLAALIATLRLARNRGGNVRVQASKPHIRQVMELTGLTRVFALRPTRPIQDRPAA